MSIKNINSTLIFFKFNEKNNFTTYSTTSARSNLLDNVWNMDGNSLPTIVTPTIITEIELITMYMNNTVTTNNNKTSSNVNSIEIKLIIPLYVIIFVLAILGNILVLVTLAQNKRMRTVTNVYLLNLAFADFLLGVFCMPFTLVGQLLRNFIFGATVCKIIPYFQAVSVSVGVWTLVAISLERYCAICRPLKSRSWQTQFHAYKMIILVWISSLVWNSPILSVTTLKPIRGRVPERYKCREDWTNVAHEQAYNLFLDIILLIIPLLIMSLAYFLIMRKLWKGLKVEIKHNSKYQQDLKKSRISSVKDLTATSSEVESQNHIIDKYTKSTCSTCSKKSLASLDKPRLRYEPSLHNNSSQYNSNKLFDHTTSFILKSKSKNTALTTKGSTRIQQKPFLLIQQSTDGSCDKCFKSLTSTSTNIATSITDDCTTDTTYTFNRHAIRSNYMDRSIDAKKKVIRMLFVIVAEFFICWTPIHVLNTWYLFDPVFIYKNVGPTGISLVHLLSYISSCCNPITYCFMNRRFRQAFLNVFYYNSIRKLCLSNKEKKHPTCHLNDEIRNSDVSRNSTMFIDPTSNIGRSGKNVL